MKENVSVLTIIVCISIVVVTFITSVAYYHVNDRKLMSTNISEAVAKGMDPLSVRCSYTHSADTVCVAYAASLKK